PVLCCDLFVENKLSFMYRSCNTHFRPIAGVAAAGKAPASLSGQGLNQSQHGGDGSCQGNAGSDNTGNTAGSPRGCNSSNGLNRSQGSARSLNGSVGGHLPAGHAFALLLQLFHPVHLDLQQLVIAALG